MKKHIVKVLQWALTKFAPEPEEITAWPFPTVSEDFEPRPVKKPTLKKATTRVKKPAVAAKTARTKKAK
jgi:hypothetical protein